MTQSRSASTRREEAPTSLHISPVIMIASSGAQNKYAMKQLANWNLKSTVVTVVVYKGTKSV